MLEEISPLLPKELLQIMERLPPEMSKGMEEIRVREHRPLEVGTAGGFYYVGADGALARKAADAYRPTQLVCKQLLERLTNHSLYAMDEELRRGYITVAGGHRVGLAGRTVLEMGRVKGIRDIGGFNIRIAREVIGAADRLLPALLDRRRKTLLPSLILAPPQQGKTTLIRDIARSASYGIWRHIDAAAWPARKVGIVDERSEIAACVRGIPSFDVGPRTDVMDACPKAEGMMMLLRSMSPEILIVDEIGRQEDADALKEASHAGVSIVATAHAYDLEDARGRPVLRALLEEGVFAACVLLRRDGGGLACQVVPLKPGERDAGAANMPSRARGHPASPQARAAVAAVQAAGEGGGEMC